MKESNSELFLKEIFPVLFVLPSIYLFGLGILGILTLFMRHETKKILFFTTSFVLINSILAFYLRSLIPGILLIFSSLTFLLAGVTKN